MAWKYDHPCLCRRSAIKHGEKATRDEDDVPDRKAFCAPLHITRIEPIDGEPRERRPKREG